MSREGLHNEVTCSAELLDVKSQLALDIQNFLSKFNNRSYGIRLLAAKVNLAEKTVKRLLDAKNYPTYPTLFQFYCFFTKSRSHDELLSKVPKVIKEELIKKRPTKQNETLSHSDFDFFSAIKKQPLLGEIYLVAVTEGIDRHKVLSRYGQFGMELVEELIANDLLRAVDRNNFTVSPNGPQFDQRVIHKIGMHFSERFFKMSNSPISRNAIGFYADCLNEEGFKKWLDIEKESYYKKLEVAKNEDFQGPLPVFAYGVVDTMSVEEEQL